MNNSKVWYNEINAFAASWLHELGNAGAIAPGHVEERSVVDIKAAEVQSATRAHFFAGIGGWEYALKLAGWPEGQKVWTGSCPCQPFSVAGKHKSEKDSRHLWPSWLPLIAKCRPPVIFGEQVASKLGREWLSGVRTDLEALGYAVGATDLCAAGAGAPHIRQRLYWVAHADGAGTTRLREHGRESKTPKRLRPGLRTSGLLSGMGNASRPGLSPRQSEAIPGAGRGEKGRATEQPSHSFWSHATPVACKDGKTRPIEPGSFPVAHGVPGRVGRLRGYGNAIVPEAAAEFIKTYMQTQSLTIN